MFTFAKSHCSHGVSQHMLKYEMSRYKDWNVIKKLAELLLFLLSVHNILLTAKLNRHEGIPIQGVLYEAPSIYN